MESFNTLIIFQKSARFRMSGEILSSLIGIPLLLFEDSIQSYQKHSVSHIVEDERGAIAPLLTPIGSLLFIQMVR